MRVCRWSTGATPRMFQCNSLLKTGAEYFFLAKQVLFRQPHAVARSSHSRRICARDV